MKNLLLGAFDNYDYSQLQYWVNSFKATGSDADIAVVVANATRETVEKLGKQGITIIAFNQDANGNFFHQSNIPIQTERFFHYWNFLNGERVLQYDYVLHTDMKDVVFQTDPFETIDALMADEDCNILSATECITYENEDWGRQNFLDTFGPYMYEQYKHCEIQNVGIIAGDALFMKDLFLQIFLGSINRPVAICEQAVYNQLIATRPWNNEVSNVPMSAGFCTNLGTVMDPRKIEKYRPFLTEPEPYCNQEFVLSNYAAAFSIVHQYDRVPGLKAYFERKFSDV